jgi:hypothetical protein
MAGFSPFEIRIAGPSRNQARATKIVPSLPGAANPRSVVNEATEIYHSVTKGLSAQQ